MLKNFKTNYKTGFYILISLGIIVLSLLYIMWINFSNDTELVIAQEGLIDLKELDGQETIELNGEWEFYPNLLLGPEDNFDEYSHLRKYVEVPGSWEPYLRNNSSVEGGGTYRLRIHLPRDGDYGFKFRTIRSAYRAFANGNEIVSVGNTSLEWILLI